MVEKTPVQVRAAISDKLKEAEKTLQLALSLDRELPSLRTPGHVRSARAKRDRLIELLAAHDSEHPRA